MRTALVIPLLVAAISLQGLGVSSQAPAQSGAFTITPVARTGDPISGGGSFDFCSFCDGTIPGQRGLNDAGQVLISGFLSNCTEGVFVVSGRQDFEVADFCHTTPFGRLSAFFGANLNNQGQVALNMAPNINNTFLDMILLYSDGQLTKVAGEGDRSPTGQLFGFCGFSQPTINDNGDVAFTACLQTDQGNFAGNGVYVYSAGQLRKIVVTGDPAPSFGTLAMSAGDPQPSYINNNGDVLFQSGQVNNPSQLERTGLFLARADGSIRKIELGFDGMPNGSVAASNSVGVGTLNNRGDVAYSVLLSGKPRSGVFLYLQGLTYTIIVDGEPTPVGGTFSLVDKSDPLDFPMPVVNDNGAVAFQANVVGASTPAAVFLASAKALVKVVAVGDRLPTGERIRGISALSINNLGQVAFFAHASNNIFNPIGVYVATPNSPSVSSVKVKGGAGNQRLVVDGEGFITNDSVIEIGGQPVETQYPPDFQQEGGTTTRLVSRDPQLQRLLRPGQVAHLTILNLLTTRASDPFAFSE